ncbi:MAG: hypothetical protein P8104_05515 [Gammaproteobacteria bacterium]
MCGIGDAEAAIKAASDALPAWKRKTAAERACNAVVSTV